VSRSYISCLVVHWANRANELINFITLPCVLLGSWSWWNEPVIVSLNFILFQKKTKKHRAPHHHIAPQIPRYQKKKTTTKKNPKKNQSRQTVPASMGLCLELAYPITSRSESRDSRDSAPFRHRLPLNSFIDSILRTVYHASAPPPDGHGVRRQIIFTSSSPDACAAVNWKQPNCPYLPSSSLHIPPSPPLFFFPYSP
jgi:hypothetical protein